MFAVDDVATAVDRHCLLTISFSSTKSIALLLFFAAHQLTKHFPLEKLPEVARTLYAHQADHV